MAGIFHTSLSLSPSSKEKGYNDAKTLKMTKLMMKLRMMKLRRESMIRLKMMVLL